MSYLESSEYEGDNNCKLASHQEQVWFAMCFQRVYNVFPTYRRDSAWTNDS